MDKEGKKRGNVPNLRFPGFVGEWATKTLGEITIWSSGGTPPKENPIFWNGDIPWISASSMRGLIYSESEHKLTQAGLKKGSKLAPKGSLLILVRGSMLFNKIPIGIVSRDVAFNQDVKSVIVNEDSTSEYILGWFTACEAKILNMVTGTGIGAGKLDLQDLRALKIKMPSITEQKKIASFLALLNERIQTQSKIIKDLRVLLTSLSKKLLSRSLSFSSNRDSEWETRQLGEILTIGSGKDYKHLNRGEVPVFGTGGLMTYVDKFLYEGETVCIGRKGTIDKPMYFSGKIWTVDTLFFTHSFKNILPKFVLYRFRLINWKEYNEASGVPSLSKSTIEQIEIEVPPISEQVKIIKILSHIDEKIDNENKILSMLRKQRSYCLKALFI